MADKAKSKKAQNKDLVPSNIKQSFTQLSDIRKEFNKEQIDFIVETVAPGLNEKETWLFLLKASKLGLNPLLGEIHAFVHEDRGRRKLAIIEGKHGKKRLAYNTGKVEQLRTRPIYVKTVTTDVKDDEGNKIGTDKVTIETEPWDGNLWGAESIIKRSDMDEPVMVRVPLSEYKRNNNIWKGKPETMIKKVAESQAISDAFPELADLTGEAERFDDRPATPAIEIEGGNKPASDAQIETLVKLGHDRAELEGMNLSKQDAANMIVKSTAKGSK